MESEENTSLKISDVNEAPIMTKGLKRFLIGLGVVIISSVMILGYSLFGPKEFDPLNGFDVQTVEAPRSTIQITDNDGNQRTYTAPLIRITNEDPHPNLDVTAKKCSTEEIVVEGYLQWRRVEPSTFYSEREYGQTPRLAGCTTFAFDNEIPDEVLENLKRLNDDGWKYTVWQIVGTETPIDPVGKGQPWQTENFILSWEVSE